MSHVQELRYAGDVSVTDAYAALAENTSAVLVDCRTHAEWVFVGVPDLSKVAKTPVFCEWQMFPNMEITADFAEILAGELTDIGADLETPIYFLCRSGARSRAAAIAMTAAGYRRCFNVAGGFEGDLDATRHRGTVSGWKTSSLPWVQT